MTVLQFPDKAPRVGVALRSQRVVEELAAGEITVEDAFLLASDLLYALRKSEVGRESELGVPGGDQSAACLGLTPRRNTEGPPQSCD